MSSITHIFHCFFHPTHQKWWFVLGDGAFMALLYQHYLGGTYLWSHDSWDSWPPSIRPSCWRSQGPWAPRRSGSSSWIYRAPSAGTGTSPRDFRPCRYSWRLNNYIKQHGKVYGNLLIVKNLSSGRYEFPNLLSRKKKGHVEIKKYRSSRNMPKLGLVFFAPGELLSKWHWCIYWREDAPHSQSRWSMDFKGIIGTSPGKPVGHA